MESPTNVVIGLSVAVTLLLGVTTYTYFSTKKLKNEYHKKQKDEQSLHKTQKQLADSLQRDIDELKREKNELVTNNEKLNQQHLKQIHELNMQLSVATQTITSLQNQLKQEKEKQLHVPKQDLSSVYLKQIENLTEQLNNSAKTIITLQEQLKKEQEKKSVVEPTHTPESTETPFVEELDTDTPYKIIFSNGLYLTLDLGLVSLQPLNVKLQQTWCMDEAGHILSADEKGQVLEIRNRIVQCSGMDFTGDEDDMVSREFNINFVDSTKKKKYIQLKSNTKMLLGKSTKDESKLVLHVFNDTAAHANQWTFISV